MFATALGTMVILYLLVYRTKVGIAMRACSMDNETANLMGVDIERLRLGTFALSAALAASAGTLIGIYYRMVSFNMGLSVVIKAFVVAITGGIGNIVGAFFSGLVLGQIESLGAAYVSSGYRDAFVYVVLILLLLFKPGGLFGKLTQEKV
jgi:branched-chain amino acid transport system permease protein